MAQFLLPWVDPSGSSNDSAPSWGPWSAHLCPCHGLAKLGIFSVFILLHKSRLQPVSYCGCVLKDALQFSSALVLQGLPSGSKKLSFRKVACPSAQMLRGPEGNGSGRSRPGISWWGEGAEQGPGPSPRGAATSQGWPTSPCRNQAQHLYSLWFLKGKWKSMFLCKISYFFLKTTGSI